MHSYFADAIPMEYDVFITYYSDLTQVFRVDNILNFAGRFLSARIITRSEYDEIYSLSPTDGSIRLLRSIAGPLEIGNTEHFYKMLEIMQNHGNIHAKTLSEKIQLLIPNNGKYFSGIILRNC